MATTTPGEMDPATAVARLERRISLSRLAVAWERVWPALLPPLVVAALFLIASWFGVWFLLDGAARAAVLVVFGLAGIASLVPLARVEWPTRRAAIQRLDRAPGLEHRPVGALADRLPPSNADPVARALWGLHVERAAAAAEAARVERPRPDVSRRDPYMLRAAVALVTIVGAVYAGPAVFDRVAQAFRGPPPPVVIPPRIDAWITPPPYTGRAPLLLSSDRADLETIPGIPQHSVVSIRLDRAEGVTVMLDGDALNGEEEAGAASAARLFRATLLRDAEVMVVQSGHPARTFKIGIDPDRVPVISIEGQIQQTTAGALRARYRVEDDHGVAGAFARFSRIAHDALASGPDLGVAPRRDARPLYGAPEMPLSLPQARPKQATATTTRDLTSHPWAGARVEMTLVARDDAGQEGRSRTAIVELPQRSFQKPLARALIELRRSLAMDANERDRVALALDAMTLEPQRRVPDTRVFLGLRTGYHRLLNARDDDGLRSVVDHLWDVALLIEDGDLSAAERALREAQERLEQAIELGASNDEIRQLMEELRQAMQNLMRELAQQMQRDQREGRQQQRPDGNERMISRQDIERMMREIEELMRSGARDAARQRMAQLREMLEALRNARPSMQGRGQQQEQLDELSDMIREQQRLMDQTFRERQQGRQQQGQQQRGQQQGRQQQGQRGQQGQQGQQGEQGEGQEGGGQAMRDLRQRQGQLREQLQRFMDGMRQGGRDPGRQLGDADGEMGNAESQLGQGNPGDALGPQNRALDNLRRGAQQMAREMQQGEGEGGDPNGQPGQGQAQANGQRRGGMDDPLQRNPPGEDFDNSDVRVPGRADRQRAQDILDEVRRRLSDPARPSVEMDYLQRLLRPF